MIKDSDSNYSIGEEPMEDVAVDFNNKPTVQNSKKILTANNQWNSQALLDARTSEDGAVVLCKISKKELFYVRSVGTLVMLSAFGKCSTCNDFFHDSALWQPEGVDKASWPIEYVGRDCKPCHAKD